MITSNIKLFKFKINKRYKKIKNELSLILHENNHVIRSLGKNYKNNFTKKNLSKYKNSPGYRIIGMGGSSLGAQAIHDFLIHKIRKKFSFLDNLDTTIKKTQNSKNLNLIISKSGNTIETIVNANIFIKKN